MYNRIHFLNTFTANGFGGNPTAVYFSKRFIESEAMQHLSKELNVPVTAFVWRESGGVQIRYFTARCEIAACGHATLGAAAVAAEALQTDAVCFQTVSGTDIRAKVLGGNVRMLYAPRTLEPAAAEDALLKSLGLASLQGTATLRFRDTLVLVLPTADAVRNLQPDVRRLQQSSTAWEEVVVTAAAGGGKHDYVLRSFCPWIGIDEDPVTGSVQAALAPYWAERLGKQRLVAYQASARGGELRLAVEKDAVRIGGECRFLSSLN